MNKLTSSQVEQLYVFTRKHYVEHYDLQTELVDHLANGIEVYLNKNPTYTFETALQHEFKKFGIFGFMDVVSDKQKAMSKKYWKIIGNYYKEYFRLPKILMLITSILAVHTLLNTLPLLYAKYVVSALFISMLVIGTVLSYKNKKKVGKKTKKWLLEEMIFNHGTVFQVFNLLAQISLNPHFISIILKSEIGVWAMSAAIVLIAVLLHIVFFVIPQKATDILIKSYPEYKMA